MSPETHGLPRTIDDRAILKEHIVFVGAREARLRIQRHVVGRRRDLSKRFSRNFLRGVRVIARHGHMFTYSAKNQVLTVGGIHVTRHAFAGDHKFLVQGIVGTVRSGFCVHMAAAGRIHLNFGQCSIFPKDGQPAVEILIIFCSDMNRR